MAQAKNCAGAGWHIIEITRNSLIRIGLFNWHRLSQYKTTSITHVYAHHAHKGVLAVMVLAPVPTVATALPYVC